MRPGGRRCTSRASRSRKGKWQISTNGGSKPAWDGRDKQVFYLDAEGSLLSVAVSVTAGGVTAGQPHPSRTDALPKDSDRNSTTIPRPAAS